MKLPCALAILAAGSGFAHAADLTISEFDRAGTIRWSNAFPSGVISIQSKSLLAAPWAAGASYFTSNTVGAAQVAFAASNGFFRLLSVDRYSTGAIGVARVAGAASIPAICWMV